MKRHFLFVVIVALALTPAAAQWRLDLGVDVPKGVGTAVGGSISGFADAATWLSDKFFPFPEASLYYQFGGGLVTAGVGLRAFTFIVESVAWPNAFVELTLGPAVVEAQVGGGLFAAFGLGNSIQTGKVFFPDLSAWFKLGKTFRLGVGAMGLLLPDLTTDTIPFVFYVGGKAVINFK